MAHPELSQLLECLNAAPGDELLWLAVADWLEENGEPLRAELLRLNRELRGMKKGPTRTAAEARVRELVNGGVRPCIPEIVNSLGMRFALIPPGTFRMGSPSREKGRDSDETRHEVTLTRPFWMGVFPVTQAQYRAVMGSDPSAFSAEGRAREDVTRLDTANFPADSVTWANAVAFCQALTRRAAERASGNSYRLPTEAEWEYACRAGLASGRFHFGDITRRARQANFEEGGPGRPCPVGMYPPNAWGLFDMHGNICEWCQDWKGDHPEGPLIDPRGPRSGKSRVLRGGSWEYSADDCRSAARDSCAPTSVNTVIGFRVVRAPSR
jgi:uncharacterized protein (TIGR02996 family)